VQLVDKRSKLGWVIVSQFIMSKKLIVFCVSLWSDPWDRFACRLLTGLVSFRFLFCAVLNRLNVSIVAGMSALSGFSLNFLTNSSFEVLLGFAALFQSF
jgi:hypothetical protein